MIYGIGTDLINSERVEKLLNKSGLENKENFKRDKIYNVSDLVTATNKDLTFFHSKKYYELA